MISDKLENWEITGISGQPCARHINMQLSVHTSSHVTSHVFTHSHMQGTKNELTIVASVTFKVIKLTERVWMAISLQNPELL